MIAPKKFFQKKLASAALLNFSWYHGCCRLFCFSNYSAYGLVIIWYWCFAAQKMKFSISDFFGKCDQIRRKLRIWSHLLKKSVVENFIFFVQCFFVGSFVAVYIHRTCSIVSDYFLGTSLIISIILEIVYQGFERPLTVCFFYFKD